MWLSKPPSKKKNNTRNRQRYTNSKQGLGSDIRNQNSRQSAKREYNDKQYSKRSDNLETNKHEKLDRDCERNQSYRNQDINNSVGFGDKEE